jgi:hypothetical protein
MIMNLNTFSMIFVLVIEKFEFRICFEFRDSNFGFTGYQGTS